MTFSYVWAHEYNVWYSLAWAYQNRLYFSLLTSCLMHYLIPSLLVRKGCWVLKSSILASSTFGHLIWLASTVPAHNKNHFVQSCILYHLFSWCIHPVVISNLNIKAEDIDKLKKHINHKPGHKWQQNSSNQGPSPKDLGPGKDGGARRKFWKRSLGYQDSVLCLWLKILLSQSGTNSKKHIIFYHIFCGSVPYMVPQKLPLWTFWSWTTPWKARRPPIVFIWDFDSPRGMLTSGYRNCQ